MRTQTIASAISTLSGLLSEQQTSFDGLAALNDVRQQINDLFDEYATELRSDPAAEPIWRAVSAALKGPATSNRICRVQAFWDEHSEKFEWDFLPMEMVHTVYSTWAQRNYPTETPLEKRAFTRRLREALPECSPWQYSRSRPGTLMRSSDPLARAVGWHHDGSDAAIYGLRRQGV